MAATTGLITVAEFEKLVRDNVRLELRHGEVITMPPPGMAHFWIARRIRQALEQRLGAFGVVDREIPVRPLPESEVWIADVAFLSRHKAEAASTRWLLGVPDLVVKVLSPANTAEEMLDREDTCLTNGGKQFWTVSIERITIKVTSAGGRTANYRPGDEIDLAEFGGGKLAVSQVFSE